jgi:hypothetical protein
VLTEQWTVPELGPSLGSLTDPPSSGGPRSPLGLTFDDIRLDLVTGIFDLAGAGREFAAAGDRDSAMASLGRVAWIGLWERAVGSVAARLGGAANTRLRAAAAESRFPKRRLLRILLGPSDLRAIAARLGSSGTPFVSALDELERSLRSASGTAARAGTSTDEWRVALEAGARRLETAWLALISAAGMEEEHWRGEAERIRTWRKPRWPLWLITLAVIVAAGYLGLVVGGYLPVPPPLTGVTEFWWSRF